MRKERENEQKVREFYQTYSCMRSLELEETLQEKEMLELKNSNVSLFLLYQLKESMKTEFQLETLEKCCLAYSKLTSHANREIHGQYHLQSDPKLYMSKRQEDIFEHTEFLKIKSVTMEVGYHYFGNGSSDHLLGDEFDIVIENIMVPLLARSHTDADKIFLKSYYPKEIHIYFVKPEYGVKILISEQYNNDTDILSFLREEKNTEILQQYTFAISPYIHRRAHLSIKVSVPNGGEMDCLENNNMVNFGDIQTDIKLVIEQLIAKKLKRTLDSPIEFFKIAEVKKEYLPLCEEYFKEDYLKGDAKFYRKAEEIVTICDDKQNLLTITVSPSTNFVQYIFMNQDKSLVIKVLYKISEEEKAGFVTLPYILAHSHEYKLINGEHIYEYYIPLLQARSQYPSGNIFKQYNVKKDKYLNKILKYQSVDIRHKINSDYPIHNIIMPYFHPKSFCTKSLWYEYDDTTNLFSYSFLYAYDNKVFIAIMQLIPELVILKYHPNRYYTPYLLLDVKNLVKIKTDLESISQWCEKETNLLKLNRINTEKINSSFQYDDLVNWVISGNTCYCKKKLKKYNYRFPDFEITSLTAPFQLVKKEKVPTNILELCEMGIVDTEKIQFNERAEYKELFEEVVATLQNMIKNE